MNNLAIIPARGGSKRIPRKNIKNFLGKPIIAYSIQAAFESKLFAEVMVSTDDLEIAEIAKKYGASIPFFRSNEKSTDFANTFDVIEEVVIEYQKLGQKFEHICCIYPCAPFCTSAILNQAFDLLRNMNFDSVFPIVSYPNLIQRAFKIIDNKIEMVYPEYENTRSQDLPISYYDAGQFYWLKTKSAMESRSIFSKNSGGVIVDELNSQDIDTEIDWKLAEIKYSLKK